MSKLKVQRGSMARHIALVWLVFSIVAIAVIVRVVGGA